MRGRSVRENANPREGQADLYFQCTTTGRDAAGSPLPSTPRCGGLWHLSVASGLPLPVRVVELVTVHVALGVPLSFAWRRSRNLAGPALAHPVNDAVRNAAMLGLKSWRLTSHDGSGTPGDLAAQ